MLFQYFTVLFFFSSYPNGVKTNDDCLNIPPIKNMNVEQILGVWYPQDVGSVNEAAKKCLWYKNTLEVDINGTILVNIRATWQDGGQQKTRDVKSYPNGNTSSSKIVWNEIIRYSWLVGSDFKSYSIWYICIPNHTEKGIVFITTKEKDPSEATMKEAYEDIKKAGFDITKSPVYPIDRSNCNN